jgi:hypothetical protein
MRANLILGIVFAVLSFLLGLVFFIFMNVEIPFEPFKTWAQLPYANMFEYAGLVCGVGAIIYLVLEAQESSD